MPRAPPPLKTTGASAGPWYTASIGGRAVGMLTGGTTYRPTGSMNVPGIGFSRVAFRGDSGRVGTTVKITGGCGFASLTGTAVARAVATIANAIAAVCAAMLTIVPPARRVGVARDSRRVRSIVLSG